METIAIPLLFIIYSGMLLHFLAYVKRPDYREKYVVRKSIQSAAFLVVFFLIELLTGCSAFFWQVLPAFFCCFAGDVLLGVYNKVPRKRIFAEGLFIFLTGHLFFIRWMGQMQKLSAVDFIFPVIGIGLVWVVTGSRNIHTGRLRPCILLYSFFVSLLCAKGVHIFLVQRDLPSVLIALGSLLFLASDFSIIFLYFYKNRNKRIHLFNLTTYYYAMFLLAVYLLFL